MIRSALFQFFSPDHILFVRLAPRRLDRLQAADDRIHQPDQSIAQLGEAQ
jgi:hypothetical protein